MNAQGSAQGEGETIPDHDLAPPPAAAMIEAMRALGYSFQAAVADIVDNSISAGATHIGITTHWAGEETWISIVDDGRGMDREELINAMRPGSFSPLMPRGKGDLGRFGMGLKTASFSQCRRLTVASRVAGGTIEVRRWDLDHVAATGEWQLLRSTAPGSEVHLAALDSMAHGTMVLWEIPDRIIGGIPPGEPAMKRARRQFFGQVETLEHHLATTFHRFLRGSGRRTITLNGNELAPWDPLLGGWESIAQLPEERLHLDGHAITVQGTILPHPSRIEAERLAEAAGPGGWNRQQGFHVYRDGRLLSAGGWLGLGLEQDDRYRLARVRVDIPSALDQQWGVDIRKSRVTIPPALRDDLRRIARMTRDHALNVYRQRSRNAPAPNPGEPVSLWLISPTGHGGYSYRINREHPLVDVLRQGDPAQRQAADAFIDLTCRTLPVERIWMTGPEEPPATTPSLSPADIDLARRIHASLVASGLSTGQALLRLSLMEPYADFPAAEIETLLNEEP